MQARRRKTEDANAADRNSQPKKHLCRVLSAYMKHAAKNTVRQARSCEYKSTESSYHMIYSTLDIRIVSALINIVFKVLYGTAVIRSVTKLHKAYAQHSHCCVAESEFKCIHKGIAVFGKENSNCKIDKKTH